MIIVLEVQWPWKPLLYVIIVIIVCLSSYLVCKLPRQGSSERKDKENIGIEKEYVRRKVSIGGCIKQA